jgi:arginyl-tRNA--protein-N-Asp/Glu arginylyltransferase
VAYFGIAMRFFVVSDSQEECPYREGQTARLPLRMPVVPLDAAQFDELLAQGDRRFGPFLYRPTCPSCRACEAIRVPVERYAPTRSQRRAVQKNTDVRVELDVPSVTPRHLEIYNRHQRERGLARTDEPIGEAAYRLHLVQSCVDTREVRYMLDDRMIAMSILDFGARSVSSVYHAFDPDYASRSLGVFSVIQEIALARSLGMEWYYLGLYVEDCARLSYKAQYMPHERRVERQWIEFG